MGEGRKERFDTVAEIRFSRNRDLVVSVLGDRIVLGQRIEFEDDGGETRQAFLKNAPSLDMSAADDLIKALRESVHRLQVRGGIIHERG